MPDLDELYDQAVEQGRIDNAYSEIDLEYIKECIDGQMENLIESSSKINYLKKLKKNIESKEIDEDYVKKIYDDIYPNIIDKISSRFKFAIDVTEEPMESIATNLYKFFVVQHTDNVICFLESVIFENQKDIVSELQSRENINNSRIEGLSNKISIILNNIGDVIDIINSMNYNFDDYIYYIRLHEDAKGTVEKIKEYSENYIDDTNEIVQTIMSSLINEEEGFSTIFTTLQTDIYQKFSND